MKEILCITLGFAFGSGFVLLRWRWASWPNVGRMKDRLAGLKAKRDRLHWVLNNIKVFPESYVGDLLQLDGEVAELESKIARFESP